jgi:hypothetical protein
MCGCCDPQSCNAGESKSCMSMPPAISTSILDALDALTIQERLEAMVAPLILILDIISSYASTTVIPFT